MLGWMIFVYFVVSQFVAEGAVAAGTAVAAALGIDLATALIVGVPISTIISGVGLADDMIVLAFAKQLGLLEKVALSVFLEETYHLEQETHEWWTHTSEQNERFGQYLASRNPGQTYLWGDVTPRDLIDFGSSAGVLIYKGTFPSLLDAAKEKFGGLVTETSDLIEIGGGL